MIVRPRMSARTMRKMGRSGRSFTGTPLTPEVVPPGNPRRSSLRTQRLDQRIAELLQIVRLAAGDPVSVLDHRLVLHLRADLPEVLLDGGPGGQGAALDQSGRDQQLGSVAHGGQRLPRGVELPDEADEALVGPQLVGGVAAGEDQRVVVLRPGLGDRPSGLDRDVPPLAPDLLTDFPSDDVDLESLGLKPVVGNLELAVLESFSEQDSNLLGHGRRSSISWEIGTLCTA